jgi:ABC-type glycerol-3-phosphate transport system substrate-binding protein
MIIDYPERIEDIQSLNPSISIRQSIFPQITNTENPTVYGKVYLFGILKDSKNIVLAWKLAGELTKFWNESFVKKATKEKDWRFKTEGNEALKTQINFAQTVYKYKYPEEFDKNIREAIDNVSTKKASSQKALDKAATSINQLVIENGATY